MREDVKWQKSEAFALKIIELYKYLIEDKREYILSKQILRSGTSIGANIIESEFSESTADFIHKLTISQKEAGETLYWLRLLVKSGYLEQNWFESLYNEGEEIIKILTSIIIKAKRKTLNT
ncbi:MAG: four helix bundle protein [Muribaculaceae bacterium]|nr:four helix bundle protein [Muribaculaceae bacterium]